MSVPYDIYVDSNIDSDVLLRIVEAGLGLDHLRDPRLQPARNPSLISRACPEFDLIASAEDPICAEIKGEWLGFRPTASIGFHRRHDTDPSVFYRSVLRATSAVLENVSGNLALVVNGETGMLIRRSGRVTVRDEPRTYFAEALSELRVPYEFGRIPSAGESP